MLRLAPGAMLPNLPNELTIHILTFLQPAELVLVLQLSRHFYNLALPLFRSTLDLNSASLYFCPLNLYNRPTNPSYSQLQANGITLAQELKSVTFHLSTPITVYTNVVGDPFILIHSKFDDYLPLKLFVGRTGELLQQLYQNIISLQQAGTQLSHLEIIARASTSNTLFPNPSSRSVWYAALVNLRTIRDFLNVARLSPLLQVLHLDTSDVEHTDWDPVTGLASSWFCHICPLFSEAMRTLPNLRTVYWRRKELCPQLFGAWIHGHVRSSIETLEIDMRMSHTQQVSAESWEARSRDCDVGRRIPMNYDDDFATSTLVDEGHVNTTEDDFLHEMVRCARVATRSMPNAKKVVVKGYEHPEAELDNSTRMPVEVDCIRGVRRAMWA